MTTSRQPIALIAVLVLLSAAAAVVLPQLFDSTDKRESTATPQRLVSLTPAVSDVLVELGIADNVVGRSDYCASPEIESASMTGTGIQPNYEAIVALKPDLVLAAASAGLDVATLSKIAPVEALGWSNLDALMASIQRLGTLTDKSAEADALVKRFQERFDSKVAPDGPRTLLILDFGAQNEGQMWFIKPNSLHGEALVAAGARNAIETAVVGSPTLSLEALIELDPDVIVSMVARDDLTDEERAARKARIASIKPLKAARTDNIYILDGQWVFGEGTTLLRLVDALKDIISAVEVLDD